MKTHLAADERGSTPIFGVNPLTQIPWMTVFPPVYHEIRMPNPVAAGKALFLDRDGVVNVEKNYVFRIEDFEFCPGIFDLCRAAQENGYAIVIVTNQSGIARGLYTEEDFARLTDWMLARFRSEGVAVAKVYYSPFHPHHGVGEYKRDSEDRKPKPGMLLRAVEELNLDLARCILVGDRESDIEAGISAGVGLNVLLRANEAAPKPADANFVVVKSLTEIEAILRGR